MQLPMFGNVQIPIKWEYSVERHFIPSLWVFEEIRSYYETQIIHSMGMGNVTFTMRILWGKLIYSHAMGFE